MKQLKHLRSLGAALLAVSLSGCGGDLTLPGTSVAGLKVRVVGGADQTGKVGQPLADPVVVQVQTDDGSPIVSRKVAFVASAGGAAGFTPDTAVTDSKGEALTRWVLGTAPGTYTAEARVVAMGDTTVLAAPFQADAVAGDPDTLRAVGPTSQPGRRGQTLADPLTVMVVDRFGNRVGGVDVTWNASKGDGEVSQETVATDADGLSSVIWTLGNSVGVQKVEAKVDKATGSPVSFTAVVLF